MALTDSLFMFECVSTGQVTLMTNNWEISVCRQQTDQIKSPHQQNFNPSTSSLWLKFKEENLRLHSWENFNLWLIGEFSELFLMWDLNNFKFLFLNTISIETKIQKRLFLFQQKISCLSPGPNLVWKKYVDFI